jgi:hypothetical protein
MTAQLWIVAGLGVAIVLWPLGYLLGLLLGAARYAVVWTDLTLCQDTFTRRGARRRVRWHQRRSPLQTYRIWDRLRHQWITP